MKRNRGEEAVHPPFHQRLQLVSAVVAQLQEVLVVVFVALSFTDLLQVFLHRFQHLSTF